MYKKYLTMKKIDKKTFENIVKECYTIADVCRKIGWQPRGGNYKAIHRYIDEYNVDTSHFTSQRTNLGNILNKDKEKKAEYYLKEKSYVRLSDLKWKLFSEGLKEYKCEKCGCTSWNGKQISLQLHHVNGNPADNRLENLQILCPNCHSQTDNYCGRNVPKNGKVKRYYCKNCLKEIEKTPSGLCDECYQKMIDKSLSLTNITPNQKIKVCGKCIDCGKEIYKDSIRCTECNYKLHRKVEWPTKEELEKLIYEKPFTTIAKKYGVSDKSIVKWCKHYGLPYRKKDIRIF